MRRPQNWKKYPTCFDKTVAFTQLRQNRWEIYSNFCGLFRKARLYIPAISICGSWFTGELILMPEVGGGP